MPSFDAARGLAAAAQAEVCCRTAIPRGDGAKRRSQLREAFLSAILQEGRRIRQLDMHPCPVKMLLRPCLSTIARPSPSHSLPWPFHPPTLPPSTPSPPSSQPHNHPTHKPLISPWTRNLHWSAGCKRLTSTMQPSWLIRQRDGRWRSLSLGIRGIHCDVFGTGVCRSAIGARRATGSGAASVLARWRVTSLCD